MREFIGIELGRENVPDATTLLKCRRLLEQHDLPAAIKGIDWRVGMKHDQLRAMPKGPAQVMHEWYERRKA